MGGKQTFECYAAAMNGRVPGRAVALYVVGLGCIAAAGWLFVAKQPANPNMRYAVLALVILSVVLVRTAVRQAKEHRLRR